ncbi:MAG TPA: glycosyltransferase [Candidatus Dormibacteraeota bacterium]|nr:glycosyltransferase [Candidatus Dormibacteraeota bacterium]
MDISVVIPTYNRIDTLRHVIPALLRQDISADRYEIVVADSNSNDGTAEYLAEISDRDERLRHVPGPYTGRAGARNAGIRAARGAVVLFTDADIIASPDLLSRHWEHHKDRERVAVVGMELQVSSFAEYLAQSSDTEARKPLHPSSRKQLSWLYFLTGNASVRKADLEAVGMFDEDFTGYGHEDLELGYRLQQAGVTIVYEPRAVNYHWHPVGYDEQKGRMELAGRSTVRFYRKHPDPRVQMNLGMTPVSLWLHALLGKAPAVYQKLERAGRSGGPKNSWPHIARQIVYQYHYVSGIKRALASAESQGVK